MGNDSQPPAAGNSMSNIPESGKSESRKSESREPESRKPMAGNRLAKTMARHGLCSRRQAEQWIKDGRVRVNQEFIRTPAFNVNDTDIIEVDGTAITEKRGTRVWLYHKPAGLVVTESDPEGRPTVFEEFARRSLPRVLTVGRLDINTEGLLMLTNDGGLKRTLELPATGWLRRYRVRAHGRITQERLDRLKHGITVEGVKYGPIEAKLEREQGSNVWLIIALSEGKNREIKNVLAALGLQVNRLIRTSFGPFQLGDIPVGAIETVKARILQDQLGQKLAKKAGVDFNAPMPDALVPAQTEGSRPRGRTQQWGKDSEAREQTSGSRDDKGARSDKEIRGDRGQRNSRDEERSRGRPKAMGFKGRDDKNQRGDARGPDEDKLRKVHFSGGRAPEMFEPQAKPKKDDKFSKGPRGGKRDDRDARSDRGPKRSFSDKPDFKRGDRNDRSDRGDRPARSERPERSERPARPSGRNRPKPTRK